MVILQMVPKPVLGTWFRSSRNLAGLGNLIKKSELTNNCIGSANA